jgi:hypothetical protein
MVGLFNEIRTRKSASIRPLRENLSRPPRKKRERSGRYSKIRQKFPAA